MALQTWLADRCRDFGLPVEEYGGWTDRGSSSLAPGGAIAHWTAGPCGATGRPSLNTVVNGRADLAGPLANVYLDRQGVCVIVAAGRANHAGDGSYRGLSGNSSVLGVEAECCNVGDWTEAQLQNYPVLLAALVAGIGRDETWAFRHCDWTSRKIDTNDLSLPWLQTQTGAALAAGGRPDREDDDMTQTTRLLTSGVAAGRIAVADAHGQRHVFTVSSDGRLIHHWYDAVNGRWGHEALTGGLDPEGVLTATPGDDAAAMLTVYGEADDGDTVLTAQWNPGAGRWEYDRLETP